MLIPFPKRDHGRASVVAADSMARSLSSEISGKAWMISGHASRGNLLRCFHALTAPGRFPTMAANAAGPPFSSIRLDGVGIDMAYPLSKVTYKGKRIITHGNVAVGNVATMRDLDHGWERLREQHERVRWARERWQRRTMSRIDTATSAARALGIPSPTYLGYERAPGGSKTIGLKPAVARRLGQFFGVNWLWLLTGQGTPFESNLTEQQSKVLALIEGMSDAELKPVTDLLEMLRPAPAERAKG